MQRGPDNTNVQLLAKELKYIARLDWETPEKFDFDQLEVTADLLGLSDGDADVERLRKRLVLLVEEIRADEDRTPPRQGRLIAEAASALLQLDKEWYGRTLTDRRNWIRARWKTNRSGEPTPIKSVESFVRNFEPEIYEKVARRLLVAEGKPAASAARRRSTPKKMPPVSPAPWPVRSHRPNRDQEVVILMAAQAMRAGPASGLIRLVREFEPYWRATEAMIYSLEGSYKDIWRAGLLHDYEHFVALPAGFYGGLVHATEIVVAAAEAEPAFTCHVVYLTDPHDTSSLYPAAASIKRECLLTRTPFLTTYGGAARWLRLEWARRVAEETRPSARELLLPRPKRAFPENSGLKDAPGALALASHDRHKGAMMDFVDTYVDFLEQSFPERWATRVTGHLLNGGSIFDEEYEEDILHDVKGHRREQLMEHIEDKTVEWEAQERESGPGTVNWIRQLTRGRQGGVVQLARKVLNDECDTVVFFQDAETPREHDMEIQVLDRSAQLAGGNCLVLYDETSAARWADNVVACRDDEQAPSPITLVEAYRRVFGVELVIAHENTEADAGSADPRGDAERQAATWRRITATAATHVVGVLLAAAAQRAEHAEPIRFGFPWGGAVRDVIGDLSEHGDRAALAGVLGLHDFVETQKATELYKSRGYAASADEWPPQPRTLRPFESDALRIVPTVGVIGARNRSLESHALVERAVEILGGSAVTYPESAFALARGQDDPLGGAPEEDWSQLDVLLISAAPLLKRPAGSGAALATALPADLAKFYEGCEGAVGTIYLERTGEGARQRVHDSYTQAGISMQQIQELAKGGSEVILVNGAEGGPARRRAAWATLNAKLVSTFVTDEAFAWEVLKQELPQLSIPGRRR